MGLGLHSGQLLLRWRQRWRTSWSAEMSRSSGCVCRRWRLHRQWKMTRHVFQLGKAGIEEWAAPLLQRSYGYDTGRRTWSLAILFKWTCGRRYILVPYKLLARSSVLISLGMVFGITKSTWLIRPDLRGGSTYRIVMLPNPVQQVELNNDPINVKTWYYRRLGWN